MCNFVVKLTLSQILQELTHFIFIIINIHLSIRTQHLSQNTQIYQNQQKSCDNLSIPLVHIKRHIIVSVMLLPKYVPLAFKIG